MGLAEEELVDPGSVSETLKCPVCMDMFEDPVFCGGRPCQHVFCRECVEQALDRSEQCPACRAPMFLRDLQPHQVIRSLLDEVIVRCEQHCGWVGRRDARAAHASVCPIVLLERSKAELAAHCERHSEIDEKLEDRDRRIQELEALVNEKDAAVVKTGRDFLELKVRLSELERQVANPDLSELVKKFATLSRKLDECQGQLEVRDVQLRDAAQRCEELEGRLEERDLQLAVFQSMSQTSGSIGGRSSNAAVGATEPQSTVVTPLNASRAWEMAAGAVAAELDMSGSLEDADEDDVDRAGSSASLSTPVGSMAVGLPVDVSTAAALGSTAEMEENRWEDPEGFSSLPTTSREAGLEREEDTMEDPCL